MDASDLVTQRARIVAALGSQVKGISPDSQLVNGVMTPPTALRVILANAPGTVHIVHTSADVDRLLSHR